MRRQATSIAYDFAHVVRVGRNAGWLTEELRKVEDFEYERDVLRVAALLHEIGRGAARSRETQADATVRIAEEMLRTAGLPEMVWDVCDTLMQHLNVERAPSRVEARLLRDADLLEDVGAMGIARHWLSAASRAVPTLYDLRDPRAEERDSDPRAYALDGMSEALERALQGFATPPGRAEGAKRARMLRAYIEALLREAGR